MARKGSAAKRKGLSIATDNEVDGDKAPRGGNGFWVVLSPGQLVATDRARKRLGLTRSAYARMLVCKDSGYDPETDEPPDEGGG